FLHRAAGKSDLAAVRGEVRRAAGEEDRPVAVGAHQRDEHAGAPVLRRIDVQGRPRADDRAQALERGVVEARHGSTANGWSSMTGTPCSAWMSVMGRALGAAISVSV